ncbi:MAG: polyphosphate kinase 1 [Candidatus Marinimicrobia bacterium]|nr:polyphosphate kinase 1 [Candidatus Neomarinimicrobiota bacterium]
MSAPTPPAEFVNRELSWLEFNQRVLDEARDPSVPLLERLKFLAITAANLDEFFMVRVGSLQLLLEQGVRRANLYGVTPRQQLALIAERTHRMAAQQAEALAHIEDDLRQGGVCRLAPDELTPAQQSALEEFFQQHIGAVATPMAIEPDAPFPTLTNLRLYLCVRLAPEPGATRARYAFIPAGASLPRFVPLPSAKGQRYAFVLLEQVLQAQVQHFFAGEKILECVPFRITRNADMSVREDLAADLVAGMQEVLSARRFSQCVRLEIGAPATKTAIKFLAGALQVAPDQTFIEAAPLDLKAFMDLSEWEGGAPAWHNPPWPPQFHPAYDPNTDLFQLIARRDMLLHHPYQTFAPVVRLIEEAAEDPGVLAIKQILYRTSSRSPIVAALKRAAENGKYVSVIVELKARFDEARNINWAEELEQAGAQVIYGVRGLKTHAKLCLIVRREPHGIVRYLHFGTGNYNERTAKLYGDLSYLTCDPDLGLDAAAFFNMITGYSQPQAFLKLRAAPLGLRTALLELIASETERCRQGQRALIIAKMNSLVDPALIRALYDASRAGVEIQLNVRGICCLRPEVPGLSENIRVISIVDRFLEHSRIYYFHQGGEPRVFIASADWMPRNLDRRIELLVPIDDPACRAEVVSILHTYFQDQVKARRIRPDGAFDPPSPPPDGSGLRAQQALYERVCEQLEAERLLRRTTFVPHTPADRESP